MLTHKDGFVKSGLKGPKLISHMCAETDFFLLFSFTFILSVLLSASLPHLSLELLIVNLQVNYNVRMIHENAAESYWRSYDFTTRLRRSPSTAWIFFSRCVADAERGASVR